MIRMPLKLKLGRTSGRYELSEDIYILTIFIGEIPMAQCTLTSISTSTDVFRYLGEKLNLNQPEIFGLQYQMKATDTEKKMMRWIEPDKPIRRQLERWACRRGQKWVVNLAILHACSNVFTLTDFMSRSAYYTLLKWDVLQNGKFALDLEKCISLAAYQLQIEVPDNKPTIPYLKMLNLLPSSMSRDPKLNTDEIYLRILNAYEKLQTMEPAYAALLYIVEIQQCEGYGEEAFPCKDGTSLEEISLGYSLDWIFVRRPNGMNQKFKWEEVREIVANKRKMSIKYGDNLTNSVFGFEDNEMARYVSTVLGWKWRHARTDAQQQRSARLSVQNLHGSVPSFIQPGSFLRRSNTNINVIRPTSELNGGTNGFYGSPNPCQFLPSTPQLSARNDQSQSTINSIQSCALRQPNSSVNSSLSVCCRSISVSQIPSNITYIRPSIVEKISPPSAAFYPTGMSAPHPPPPIPIVLPAASIAPQQQQQTSNSSQDSDWLRNEQREMLKRMLTEKRRMNKIGSSPEINTIGKSGGSGAKWKRHHIGGGGGAGFTLARKIFTSTPNLHSARQQQSIQPKQQQPAQTPTLAHFNGGNGPSVFFPLQPAPMAISPSANHRLLVNPPINSASIPSFCSPPVIPLTPLNGGSFFQLATPKVPMNGSIPSAAFFSQGQVIDENGQQHAVIYPIPQQQDNIIQPQKQSTPPPHSSIFPSSNSPPQIVGGNDESRSSPKSNATSSHSEPQIYSALQSVNSLANEQPTKMPREFSDIEFSAIPAKSLSGDFSVAIRPHNLPRNRGTKIYPYNENRVKLSGTKTNPDGYVNASSIFIPIGTHSQMCYVVSQAPIQKTIEDFWQMVWETNARLIVMLVNPHQINKDDTIPSYIPSQAKEKFTVGDFFLRLKNVSPPMQMQMFQSTTTFSLAKQGERRTIFHLYCADFSEQGVPSSMETFIGLIDAVASVKRHIENEAKKEATIPVSKSNSNTSKESTKSSNEISRSERTQSVESSGWTKKLRFEQQNGNNSNNGKQHHQNGLKASEQQVMIMKKEQLAILQCTDGASESGLYMMAEIILKCMEKNVPFDIAQLLRDLRYQRMCLVKNTQQYKFIYELVSFFEKKNRLV